MQERQQLNGKGTVITRAEAEFMNVQFVEVAGHVILRVLRR